MTPISMTIEINHRRLPPACSFVEASAMVEAALGQLRNAEAALEKQLSTLQDFMGAHRGEVAVSTSMPQ